MSWREIAEFAGAMGFVVLVLWWRASDVQKQMARNKKGLCARCGNPYGDDAVMVEGSSRTPYRFKICAACLKRGIPSPR